MGLDLFIFHLIGSVLMTLLALYMNRDSENINGWVLVYTLICSWFSIVTIVVCHVTDILDFNFKNPFFKKKKNDK